MLTDEMVKYGISYDRNGWVAADVPVVQAHQPGQHDQQRHAGGGGVPVAAPVLGKKAKFSRPFHRKGEKMVRDQYLDPRTNRWYNDRLRSGEAKLPLPRSEVLGDESFAPLGYDINGENYSGLDSAIARQKTTVESVVYRGVAMPESFNPQPGDSFVDPAYSSTSGNREMAAAFGDLRATGKSSKLNTEGVEAVGGRPVVMEIQLPSGTPALPGDSSVDEFILQRSSKFEVLESKDGGATLVVEWKGVSGV